MALLDLLDGLFGGSSAPQGLLAQPQAQSTGGLLSPPQITNPLTGATANQQKWMDALGGISAALKDAGAYLQHQPEAAGNVAAFNQSRLDRLRQQQMAGVYGSLVPQLVGQKAPDGQMFANPANPATGLSGFSDYSGGSLPQSQANALGPILSLLTPEQGLPIAASLIQKRLEPNVLTLSPGQQSVDLNTGQTIAGAPLAETFGEPLPLANGQFARFGDRGSVRILGGNVTPSPKLDFAPPGTTPVNPYTGQPSGPMLGGFKTLLPSDLGLSPTALPPGTIIQQAPTGEIIIKKAGDMKSPGAQQQEVTLAGQSEDARQHAQLAANSPAGPDGRAAGTLGSPTIDITQPGYSTAAIQEAGGLTQSAIDQGALEYAISGKLPTGLGNTSTGVGGLRKTAIQNRAGELNQGGNLAGNAANLKALTSSLTQQTQYADSTERSVNNAENGFNQVVTTFQGKVNTSNFPLVNAFENALAYHLSPGDISALRAGLTEVSNEYANVFSRGGQVTDAVRNKADAIANGDLSIDQLKQVQAELQAQGRIVAGGARNQAVGIQGRINGILTGGAAPQPPQQKIIKYDANGNRVQ